MGIVLKILQSALENEIRDMEIPITKRDFQFITKEDMVEFKKTSTEKVKELKSAIKILTTHGFA